jgi:hypothetical protein
MQLCMHRLVVPKLLRMNSALTTGFCLRFVLNCIELTKREPQVFYRPVARIFMTIAVSAPMLFISYHMLFLGRLPIGFIQFRNVILGAGAPATDERPPIGFSVSEQMRATGIDRFVLDRDMTMPKIAVIVNALKRGTKIEEGLVPVLIWQFVIFCLNAGMRNLADFFVRVCDGYMSEDVRWIIVALIDQIRYQNAHTLLGIEILRSMFKKCRDDVKELVVVELVRRVMCVTPPPGSVLKLLASIDEDAGAEFDQLLAERGGTQFFAEAREFSKTAPMSKSSSGLALR